MAEFAAYAFSPNLCAAMQWCRDDGAIDGYVIAAGAGYSMVIGKDIPPVPLSDGDWLVINSNGTRQRVRDEIFRLLYKPVE